MKTKLLLSILAASSFHVAAFAEEAQADAPVVREVIVLDIKAPVLLEKNAPEAAAEKAEEKGDANADEVAEKPEPKEPTQEELRRKMRDLERQLREARNAFQQRANDDQQQKRVDPKVTLEDIKLPENPTRQQAVAYVEALRKACEGRRSFSSSDPATLKLKELPPKFADLLITEMQNRTSLRYYANYAMREIEPENIRQHVIDTLSEKPNNIGMVVMHGWVEDVRDHVIAHIESADGNITPAWFQAAVELDEPSLYPKLHELTIQSRNAAQFINMLGMLSDYDLAHTVDVCWRRAKEGKLSVSTSVLAQKAAEYGNVEALGTVITQMRTSTSYFSHSSSFNARRTNVLRFIDFRGSNDEIRNWYEQNKDELVFDKARGRFVLPEPF
jgi:Skp family chaperone for outer membrane proteins